MQSARLPVTPSHWSSLPLAYIGNSARLLVAGVPMYDMPEILVAMDRSTFLAREPSAVLVSESPSTFLLNGWRIYLAPDGFEQYLSTSGITIDAFAVLPDGVQLDPLGGIGDMRDGVIKVDVARVARDSLFALRLVTLASETGLELSAPARHAIRESASGIFDGVRDDILYLLTRLLVSRHPTHGLELLRDTQLLAFLLPEVSSLIDFHRSCPHHHKDVWRHTCQVVAQALPRPILRWAALLHDIGKVHTRSYTPKGQVHFFRHDNVGAYMFEGIASRLNFPDQMTESIRLLILYHLRPAMYESSWSDSAVRRFSMQLVVVLPDLMELARADITSKRPKTRRRAI
jgi:poly(A) polymerase